MRCAEFVALALSFSASSICSAQPPVRSTDRYPKIRAVMQEAESASAGLRNFADRDTPEASAGRLYARAGYLTEAERAFGRISQPAATPLLKAFVVYGDLADADRVIAAIADPGRRTSACVTVADTFWRMHKPDEARKYLEEARSAAERTPNAQPRAALLKVVNQELEYVAEPAPDNSLYLQYAADTRTQGGNSRIPQFPITTEGFAGRSRQQRDAELAANEAVLEHLYTGILNRDRAAIERVKCDERFPFQKALVAAAIEHICIQAHQPAAAEHVAQSIPEQDHECVLAKAEALSAAAAEWLRAGNAERANAGFEHAVALALSANDLPLGQVTVLASIGEEQAHGGLTTTSQTSLQRAAQVALTLPPAPPGRPHSDPSSPPKHHRPEAYERIFVAALRAHDLATARNIAALWAKSGPHPESQVVESWVSAREVDEALAFARSLHELAARAQLQFTIASRMLDWAGAPNI